MMKSKLILLLLIFAFTLEAYPCTNFLVTKGASADGSTMISYSADAGGFMEPLYYAPAAKHPEVSWVDIYEWDSGKHLGKIKQVPETYKVIGNMNEYQVAIGETTFGGREELRDTNAIMDYGSLMYIALQRAKTAREAIRVMTELVAEYGYYSSGESFSIADPEEVWMMEMISKGPYEKGAVWVAVRIPDGYVAAHANQARIRQFPLNDPENCMYAPDVISFAIERGYYNPKQGPFSFADAYCPLEPSGLLFCEGRVWSLFRRAAPSLNLSSDYWRAYEGEEPYPLYIKPDKKLTPQDVMNLMRDHFNDTEFDMTKGLAAEPFGNPYRWKPLVFKITGDTTTYAWERPISTQQTAFSFVSQSRSFLPREIAGVFWYGVDDTYSTVYVPLYVGAMNDIPKCFKGGSIKELDLNSAFWIFNLVANLAYTKYSYIIKDIQVVQKRLESKYEMYQPIIEKAAIELYQKDKASAMQFLSDYSLNESQKMFDEWFALWKQLVVKYNDGYINDVNVDNGRHPKGVGYGDEFFNRVVKERPGYYEVKMKKKKDKKKGR